MHVKKKSMSHDPQIQQLDTGERILGGKGLILNFVFSSNRMNKKETEFFN
jgi:hypothetical protein